MDPVPSGLFKLPGAAADPSNSEPASDSVSLPQSAENPQPNPAPPVAQSSPLPSLGVPKAFAMNRVSLRPKAPAGDPETPLHIRRHGRPMGPYNKDEMEALMQEGKLLSTDLYCLDGTDDWHPLVEWPHWLPLMLEAKQQQRFDRHAVPVKPIDHLITILCWVFLFLCIAAMCGFWLSIEGK